MINKLAELAKEERVLLDYCISPDNSMIIYVFANKFEDFLTIYPLSSYSDDEIIEITKDVIKRVNR